MALNIDAVPMGSSSLGRLREDRILEALFSFRNDILEEILKLKQLLLSSVLQNQMLETTRSDNTAQQQQQLAAVFSEVLQSKMKDLLFSKSNDSGSKLQCEVENESPASSAVDNENLAEFPCSEIHSNEEDRLADNLPLTSNSSRLNENRTDLHSLSSEEINVKSEVSEDVCASTGGAQLGALQTLTDALTASGSVQPVLPVENDSDQISDSDYMLWSEPNVDLPAIDNFGRQSSYTCVECGKEFAYRSGLEKHFRIHTGVRPYKCKLCGKSFAQKGSLKYHIDIHTGQKRHKCSVCGKSFVHKGNLNYHVKTHHIRKSMVSSNEPNTSQHFSSHQS